MRVETTIPVDQISMADVSDDFKDNIAERAGPKSSPPVASSKERYVLCETRSLERQTLLGLSRLLVMSISVQVLASFLFNAGSTT